MDKNSLKKLKWQLTRERLHIISPDPSPSRPQERRIGEILTGILNKEKLKSTNLPDGLNERWPLIAGAQIAAHTHPAFLRNGILYIYADHPGWLTETNRLPKAHLLKKIAAIPTVSNVRDIRFQLDPNIRTFRR